MKNLTALFSVYDKTDEQLALARLIEEQGGQVIASGGTNNKFLGPAGVKVTDVSEITGQGPILGHRVVTLSEEIHGGLLAKGNDLEDELDEYGWPKIDLLVCTFYPLHKTIASFADPRENSTEINEMVDIGGPTMVSSACKGDRIVIVDNADIPWVMEKLPQNSLRRPEIKWLQAKAVASVAAYRAAEAVFRMNEARPS